MAERRMFTEKITDADAFTSMPASAQALYFHLNMNADDDGFCNKINLCMVNSKASPDDFKILLAKRFIIQFESGVIVIKHWRMHNLLRKDRYTETDYIDEKSRLFLKENGAYTLDQTQGKKLAATKWQPDDNQMAPQDRIGKSSEVYKKERINKKERNFDDIISESHFSEPVKTELYEFIKMRTRIRKPLTNHALELILKDLQKLSNGDERTAIAIIDQSIKNSWQGLFELKQGYQDQKPQKTAIASPYKDLPNGD